VVQGRRHKTITWSKQGRAKPEEPIQKRAKQTRTGGVAQVVESLLNKSKVLSSNTSTGRKKNKVKKTVFISFLFMTIIF
jgi:hypothetical protein